MSEKRYSYYAFGLVAILFLITFLPKIPAAKMLISLCPLNPLPVVWCIVVLFICFLLPRVHVPGRLRVKNQVWGMAFSGTAIFLALRFGAGFLLQSIATSPYDLSPSGIVTNLLDIVPALIAREMVRAYTLGTVCRNPSHSRIWIPAIVLILCLLEVNFSKIPALKSTEEWFIYIAKDILPIFTQGWLLTVLVLYGGAVAGIICSVSIGVFIRVFPFLPSLPWIAESALGIAFPVIMALFLWGWYKALIYKRATRRQENLGPFTVTLVFTVAFAWFVVGVFPVYPSVILTGSMEPDIFPGDVVLIQKFLSEKEIYNLSENDVINFKREDITINHRIIAVMYDPEGNISFQTKGDNNKMADQTAVLPTDLNGIVTRVIPKAGLPVLWLQRNNPVPEGVLNNETG